MDKVKVKMDKIKEGIGKLSGRQRVIALVLVGAMFIGVGGYCIYSSQKDRDPLTNQLHVKDAILKGGEIQSPYGVSKETFDKAVKEDTYLNSKYKFTDSYNEEVTNLDNRELYKVSKVYHISGINNEVAEASKLGFYSNIKTFNDFKNANSLTISYNYKESSEVADINKSISGIVGKLFNKEIADYTLSDEANNHTVDVESKSGEYKLQISRMSNDTEGGDKQLTVMINFDRAEEEGYDLTKIQSEPSIKKAYEGLELFNGVDITELAKKYSDVVGDYADTRLSMLVNKHDELGGMKKDTSSMLVRTVYGDKSATSAEITIREDSEGGENIGGLFNIDTSIRYRESADEVMDDAVRIIEGILSTELDITDEELASGSITKEVKKEINGHEFSLNIKASAETNDTGIYGVINISGV